MANANIQGQPHQLAYITPGEARMLRAMGGGMRDDGGQVRGPGGIPAYPQQQAQNRALSRFQAGQGEANVPHRADIAGDPHFLSYITPQEAMVLRQLGGGHAAGGGQMMGPQGEVPAFGAGAAGPGGSASGGAAGPGPSSPGPGGSASGGAAGPGPGGTADPGAAPGEGAANSGDPGLGGPGSGMGGPNAMSGGSMGISPDPTAAQGVADMGNATPFGGTGPLGAVANNQATATMNAADEHGLVPGFLGNMFGITHQDMIDQAIGAVPGIPNPEMSRAVAEFAGDTVTGAVTGITGAEAANPVGSVGPATPAPSQGDVSGGQPAGSGVGQRADQFNQQTLQQPQDAVDPLSVDGGVAIPTGGDGQNGGINVPDPVPASVRAFRQRMRGF